MESQPRSGQPSKPWKCHLIVVLLLQECQLLSLGDSWDLVSKLWNFGNMVGNFLSLYWFCSLPQGILAQPTCTLSPNMSPASPNLLLSIHLSRTLSEARATFMCIYWWRRGGDLRSPATDRKTRPHIDLSGPTWGKYWNNMFSIMRESPSLKICMIGSKSCLPTFIRNFFTCGAATQV